MFRVINQWILMARLASTIPDAVKQQLHGLLFYAMDLRSKKRAEWAMLDFEAEVMKLFDRVCAGKVWFISGPYLEQPLNRLASRGRLRLEAAGKDVARVDQYPDQSLRRKSKGSETREALYPQVDFEQGTWPEWLVALSYTLTLSSRCWILHCLNEKRGQTKGHLAEIYIPERGQSMLTLHFAQWRTLHGELDQLHTGASANDDEIVNWFGRMESESAIHAVEANFPRTWEPMLRYIDVFHVGRAGKKTKYSIVADSLTKIANVTEGVGLEMLIKAAKSFLRLQRKEHNGGPVAALPLNQWLQNLPPTLNGERKTISDVLHDVIKEKLEIGLGNKAPSWRETPNRADVTPAVPGGGDLLLAAHLIQLLEKTEPSGQHWKQNMVAAIVIGQNRQQILENLQNLLPPPQLLSEAFRQSVIKRLGEWSDYLSKLGKDLMKANNDGSMAYEIPKNCSVLDLATSAEWLSKISAQAKDNSWADSVPQAYELTLRAACLSVAMDELVVASHKYYNEYMKLKKSVASDEQKPSAAP